MPIYTRTGDAGETDLIAGVRVPKDAAVLDACGTLDELNSWLGLARCQPLPAKTAPMLEAVQRRLFDIGRVLIAAGAGQPGSSGLTPDDVAAIERLIDELDAAVPKLGGFILPGGSLAASVLHVARAVCRRAERKIAPLTPRLAAPEKSSILAFINRLSDLLFVAARAANASAGASETKC